MWAHPTFEKTLKMKRKLKHSRHSWIVASTSIVLAIILLFLMPKNKTYFMFLAGFAGGHLILGLMAIFAGWLITPQTLLNKLWKRKSIEGFDFGWSPKWIYGFLAASVLVFMLAIHAYFSLAGYPWVQFVVYTILLLLAVNLFIGNTIIRNSDRTAQITLPMVNIFANGGSKILDAGCGAGRTTIAIVRALPGCEITSFDRFDAGYIAGGGIELLKHNLKLAGIEDRVTIATGDITSTPFGNNQFDAIVSSFMFDHLGKVKKEALKESYRILKPGGRFLLVILVRGYTAFGVANIMSLHIPSQKTWKKWIEQAGFKMVCDGKINEGAYLCFEKL